MIELIQFPWSPFRIVQRRTLGILEFAGVRFIITHIFNGDRPVVWKLTRKRDYGVPSILGRGHENESRRNYHFLHFPQLP